MPPGEQTIAGKPFRVIRDISSDLPGILPMFGQYRCVVIISRCCTGKSTSATDLIFRHFGQDKTEYITFTDQRKGAGKCRKNSLRFGEIPNNKIVVFDELHTDCDESEADIEAYLQELTADNKPIILTNPYGSSAEPHKEITLFLAAHRKILPEKTLFVFVTNTPQPTNTCPGGKKQLFLS